MEVIRAFRDRMPDVTAYFACEYNLARMVDRALGGDQVVACFDSPGDSDRRTAVPACPAEPARRWAGVRSICC